MHARGGQRYVRRVQNHDLLPQVQALRASGHSPKEIARTLGVTSAVAARLVRAAAAAQPPAEPAVVGCWISPAWSTGLAAGDHPGWPLDNDPAAGGAGLVSVLAARRHRYSKASVCGYLADVYCLGVKNATGPKVMDEYLLARHVREFFSSYAGAPLEAPIELAREVVCGSVEYARRLGFEPHDDFAAAAGHLGPWNGPSPPSPSATRANPATSPAPMTTPGESPGPSIARSAAAITSSSSGARERVTPGPEQ